MTTPLPARTYPVAPLDGNNDKRFSIGLALDVAELLERHGYPPLEALDIVDLQQALYRLLYVGGRS